MKENEKRKRGFGPHFVFMDFKLLERPQRAGFSARLSQKPAEAKLKAAARAIARNKAAVKAEAKAVILG